MARMTNKKKAGLNKTLWDRANNSHRVKWQSISQKGHDFYLNEQLSKEEKETLEDSGMPTFVINRVTPIVEIMKYFITANNPRWQAVGSEGSDVDVAQVHSSIIEYCWHISNGRSVYSQVVADSLTKGVGYFMVDIDKDADLGKGEVVFKRVDPYDMYVDPMSRDFLYRDASFIIIKKNLSRTQISSLFPGKLKQLKKASGQDTPTVFSSIDTTASAVIQPENVVDAYDPDKAEDDQILGYYEVYKKKKYPYYSIFLKIPPSKDEIAQAKMEAQVAMKEFEEELSVSTKEQIIQIEIAFQNGEIIEERLELEKEKAQKEAQKKMEEFNQKVTSEIQEKLSKIEQQIVPEAVYKNLIENKDVAASIVDATKFFKTMIDVSVSVGEDTLLFEYIMPLSEYPFVPVPYMYTGTPYPMSAVTPLVGKQQEINKAHQIMLHNANLASNLRWMYEEGSVPEEEWEQYSSSPGALLKYRQGFNPPTPVLPASINNAFYTVVQEGKADAEYISGVPSSMMGFVSQQPDTYRGMLANDEFGTRRLKAWMNSVVEPCLEHLGKIHQEIAQGHYTIDKVFRIVQPEAGKTKLEEKEVRINIPIYNDYGEAIGRWMDYETAKFDVRIVAGTTLPLNRWALLEEYFKWYQAGLIDDIAMLAESDIRNKEQIVQRKSVYAQMKSSLSQQEEAIKDRDGTIETLSRQLVQAGIRHKVDVGEKEVAKDVLETEAQQKVLRGAMEQEFLAAKRELARVGKDASKKNQK